MVASGRLPDARLSSNVPTKDATQNVFAGTLSAGRFVGDGSGITNASILGGVNASQISSGTLPDRALSSNVPRLDAGSTTLAGALTAPKLTLQKPNDVALTTGRLRLSQAGTVTVPYNGQTVDVTGLTIAPDAALFATIQGTPTSLAINSVARVNGTTLRIKLSNKVRFTGLKVGYAVLN